MSSAIRLILLSLLVAFLASCGQSIFGPRQVAGTTGAVENIDEMLRYAEDFYLGAYGGVDPINKTERLASSRTIYSNLVYKRWGEMNVSQKLRSMRGYTSVTMDMATTNTGVLISSALALFTGFDSASLSFSDTNALKTFTNSAALLRDEIVNTLLTTNLMLNPDPRLHAARGEADFVSISLYHAIAVGYDAVAVVMPIAVSGLSVVTNLTAKFATFQSSVTEFQTAVTSFQTALADPLNLTNTNYLVSLSNTMVGLSNTIVSNVLMVSNAYAVGMSAINTLDGVASNLIVRNNRVTNITAPAKNQITTMMNQAMSSALGVMNSAFESVRAFRDMDPNSLLRKYL